MKHPSPYAAPGFYDDALAKGRHRDIVGGRWDETPRIVLPLLAQHGLTARDHLLDIGAGSLRLGRHLAPQVAEYWATDASRALMLKGWETELDEAARNRLPQDRLIADETFAYPPRHHHLRPRLRRLHPPARRRPAIRAAKPPPPLSRPAPRDLHRLPVPRNPHRPPTPERRRRHPSRPLPVAHDRNPRAGNRTGRRLCRHRPPPPPAARSGDDHRRSGLTPRESTETANGILLVITHFQRVITKCRFLPRNHGIP